MQILVVGAGAIGGYFGGRLLEAGRDVTFLVRPGRRAQLAASGLSIRSPLGDVDLPAPAVVTADALRDRFDLILLSCKSYDLGEAIESFAPAVGPASAILPLLNGMGHLGLLDQRFGATRVLGGLCIISSSLDPSGRILHLNDLHTIAFGERYGSRSGRAAAIAKAFEGVRIDARLSEAILHEMWEKWVFIAALAGITCLMRASIGDIVAAGGAGLATALLDECGAIAAAEGFRPAETAMERSRAMLTAPGSPLAASMFRDIERGAPTEGDHIIGDLLRRGAARGVAAPVLRIVDAHLRAYGERARRAQRAQRAQRGAESSDSRWATYPDTIVEIHASPPLRVDLRARVAPETAERLRSLGLGATWAVITAHNPGRIVERSENDRREQRLADAVMALGARFVRADGVSPDGSHREPGVAIALDQRGAIALASEFGQSAIFWFDGERFWLVPALVGDAQIRLPAV
jgi:2-dehydropantoate 2-reductase